MGMCPVIKLGQCVFVCVDKQHTLTPTSGACVATMYICHSASFGSEKSQSLAAREGPTNQTDSSASQRGQPPNEVSPPGDVVQRSTPSSPHGGGLSTWFTFSTNDGSAQHAAPAERQKLQVIGFFGVFSKIELNVLVLK